MLGGHLFRKLLGITSIPVVRHVRPEQIRPDVPGQFAKLPRPHMDIPLAPVVN